MTQKVSQAVTDIVTVFTNTATVLTPAGTQRRATHLLLLDCTEIRQTGSILLATTPPDRQGVDLLLSIVKAFGRHLSEVEQDIYEEIGNDRLGQLFSLANGYSGPYNVIYDCLNQT